MREADAPIRSWRMVTCEDATSVSGEIIGASRRLRRRGTPRSWLRDDDTIREVWRRATEATAAVVAREVDRIRDARRRGVADARLRWGRHVAVWLTREITGASYPALGRVIERDQSSVRYDCLEVVAALAESPSPVRSLASVAIARMSKMRGGSSRGA